LSFSTFFFSFESLGAGGTRACFSPCRRISLVGFVVAEQTFCFAVWTGQDLRELVDLSTSERWGSLSQPRELKYDPVGTYLSFPRPGELFRFRKFLIQFPEQTSVSLGFLFPARFFLDGSFPAGDRPAFSIRISLLRSGQSSRLFFSCRAFCFRTWDFLSQERPASPCRSTSLVEHAGTFFFFFTDGSFDVRSLCPVHAFDFPLQFRSNARPRK